MTPNETTAEKQAREDAEAAIKAAEQAAKQKTHDAQILAARAKETPAQREHREADEAHATDKAKKLAQVEECHVQLERAEDVYRSSVKSILSKLQGLAYDPEITDPAKRLAADYELTLEVKPRLQPPAPKTPAKPA